MKDFRGLGLTLNVWWGGYVPRKSGFTRAKGDHLNLLKLGRFNVAFGLDKINAKQTGEDMYYEGGGLDYDG